MNGSGGFRKTYRKRQVWGSHGKPTRVNQQYLVEQRRHERKKLSLELLIFENGSIVFALNSPKKKKKRKLAKWGRNKPKRTGR